MISGRLQVGAATMAPVGAKVSSFNASAERITISRHRPRYWQRETQCFQYAMVSCRALSANDVGSSMGAESLSRYWQTKVALCLAWSVKSAITPLPARLRAHVPDSASLIPAALKTACDDLTVTLWRTRA